MRSNRSLLILGIVALFATASFAEETAPGAAGYWSGAIEIPGRPLEVHVLLEQGEGVWGAKIDIPLQGVRHAELADVGVIGDQVTFRLPDVPGDPTFDGVVSGDGEKIAGNFTQGGRELPFELQRRELPADYHDDPYVEYEKPGSPGEGVDGDWLGLLTAGPHRYRLKLTLTTDGDATGGTIVSLDQGASELPVESVALDGGTISFGVGRINARFSGTMASDGAEITGDWSQGGSSLPLTFRRSGS